MPVRIVHEDCDVDKFLDGIRAPKKKKGSKEEVSNGHVRAPAVLFGTVLRRRHHCRAQFFRTARGLARSRLLRVLSKASGPVVCSLQDDAETNGAVR